MSTAFLLTQPPCQRNVEPGVGSGAGANGTARRCIFWDGRVIAGQTGAVGSNGCGLSGYGTRMVWLITGLLLVVFGGLVVLTRRGRRPPVADDTLLADLLGPSDGQVLPAPAGRDDAEPPLRRAGAEPPAGPEDAEPAAGQLGADPAGGQKDAERQLVPAGQPAGEGGWLETQIALIAAWSERMQEQIASWADDPDLSYVKPEPEVAASLPAGGHRADDESPEPSQARPAERCTATTAKGGRCKFAARPGDTTCAIHTKQAHP